MKPLFVNRKNILILFKRALYLCALLYPIGIFLGYTALANAILVNISQTILIFIVFTGLYIVLKDIFRWFSLSILALSPSDNGDPLTIYWVSVLIGFLLAAFATIILLLIWGVYPQTVKEGIDLILFKGIRIGETYFSLVFILKAILIYSVVYYLSRFVLYLVKTRVFPFTKFDPGTKEAISSVISYTGLCLAIIMAVYSLGISSTSLAFIVSAFTLGISFGLKEIFNNFISGVILLIERPIKVGDWVDVEGESGVVKSIRLRATVVETFNHKTLLIPNSQFVTSTVSNDLYNPVSRSEITIECSYNNDPKKITDLLIALAKNQPKIFTSPEPSVVFSNLNSSGITFKLRYHCKTAEQAGIDSDIRYQIFSAFKENGIEVPPLKQEVYLKQTSWPTTGVS